MNIIFSIIIQDVMYAKFQKLIAHPNNEKDSYLFHLFMSYNKFSK